MKMVEFNLKARNEQVAMEVTLELVHTTVFGAGSTSLCIR
jgi:hypothetical protein